MRAEEFAGLGPRTARPQLNPAASAAVHVRSPEEYFVLSRVDGKTTYEELCQISGLGVAATVALLLRFKSCGLIVDAAERPAVPRLAASQAPVAPPPSAPPAPARSLLERLDDGTPVDLAGAPGAESLPETTRVRILRLHRRLRRLAPHELLGVAADADEATVRRAYFAASKELHPDRFYGNDLGPFRLRLSEIFAQLSTAFATLQAERRKK